MAWNVFKFCTALRALGSIMIVLVLGIVGVTYYVIVVAKYGPALFYGGLDSFDAFLVLVLFHFLLVMLLWSYFTTVLTDPGGVPPNWRPSIDEESGDADPLVRLACDPLVRLAREDPDLDLNQSTMLGEPANPRTRVCRKCNRFKPSRCHHCSVCGRCILKMDHHCVWVVNCVGALNYKYFLLFLPACSPKSITKKFVRKFYSFLVTTLVTSSLLPLFIAFFTVDEKHETPEILVATFVTFVLNLSFALSILGFLIMHISLVFGNTTTIEAFQKKTNSKWHYDLGRRKNFEQFPSCCWYLYVKLHIENVNNARFKLWHVNGSRLGFFMVQKPPPDHVAMIVNVIVFGTDKRYWLIPAYSEEDLECMPVLQGFEYPTRPDWDELQQL
ncbi:hypothetical protein OIU77_023116 [Salix suchowensis]|uniref:S-acyltransferase n=1 Tax=Salix suchowensis TaxID=1278906 RepID=A0ABQ9C2N9_9ROSI|nr:hypothetical protein OIU78_009972 [Salix suchowensis]KAJ6393812.1 hypothetical protein OIU77_023116 [Salix suchowensis]